MSRRAVIRDRFDQRFPPERWEQLRREVEQVMRALARDGRTVRDMSESMMRVLELVADDGVLEAGYGGRVVCHFMARAETVIKEARTAGFGDGCEAAFAAALVEVAMCAFARGGTDTYTARGLEALWDRCGEAASARLASAAHGMIATVLQRLSRHRRRVAVQYALLWLGATTPVDDSKDRMSDADLAERVGVPRETLVRRKLEGVDLVTLLCLMGMKR